jgi:hypothetical protein
MSFHATGLLTTDRYCFDTNENKTNAGWNCVLQQWAYAIVPTRTFGLRDGPTEILQEQKEVLGNYVHPIK